MCKISQMRVDTELCVFADEHCDSCVTLQEFGHRCRLVSIDHLLLFFRNLAIHRYFIFAKTADFLSNRLITR